MADPPDDLPLWRRLTRDAELAFATKWVGFSSLIGVLSGLAGVAFDRLIRFVSETFLRGPAGLAETPWDLTQHAWVLLLVPTLGGLVTGFLVWRFAPEAEGHGTDSVIHAFHRLRGIVRKRIIFLKPVASAITIGTGGSAGQEGPVAQLGAGIGSAVATACHLSDRDRRQFLLAGATAGIGAMFCSPLGGALFMPEVAYRKPEYEGQAIIPCIIASIMAFATFTTITGRTRAIEIAPEILATLSFDDPRQLLVYLVLAILCAVVGWAYTRTFYGVHTIFGRLRVIPKPFRAALGGLLLGLTALAVSTFARPEDVFFGGYHAIHAAIEGSFSIKALFALALARILATSFTISTGGSGGVFAPSLTIGALLGAAVGQTARELFPGLHIEPACFALVGMGGFFAGVSKTPVASVVLVCEMTGGYGLLAPLLLVAVVHMLLSNRWTMYRAQVPGQVDSPAHAGEFVVDVLESMSVRDLAAEARKPHLVHADTTLRRVLREVSESRDSYFPVVDDGDRMIGIFSLADLRRIFLEGEVGDFVIARDFMVDKVVTAHMEDNLHEVMRRMTEFHINAIPIVADDDPGRVLCMLQRNDLSRGYDRRLRELRAGA